MAGIPIRELVASVTAGRIRIPAFQRRFVWEPDRVAYFMDTLYKRYPFGSLLLWRTANKLETERTVGNFEIPKGDPDYPVDYVLDGQQRLTSVFSVFQTELPPANIEGWKDIYFDFGAPADAQESQFVALADEEVDPYRHFPLSKLFDTVGYREATEGFSKERLLVVDDLQSRFKEATLPVQTIQTEDRNTVAVVFERVNRRGVPLDTLQLLTAWTWSEDFDLQKSFEELQEALEPFGFDEVGTDADLVLRCVASVMTGGAAPKDLIQLNGADVRAQFSKVVNGIKGAIDFIKTDLKIYSLDVLPYSAILVPLCRFFAAEDGKQVRLSDAQRRTIHLWFWRVCFTKRYSSGVQRNLQADIAGMARLKEDEKDDSVAAFPCYVENEFYLDNEFRTGVVNTKTLVCQLAQLNPRSFLSGALINLESALQAFNRSEFHHIYPKAFSKDVLGERMSDINSLANFCFLSRVDNNIISKRAPSEYRGLMPDSIDAISASALLPESTFKDDFLAFQIDRANLLTEHARSLVGDGS